MMLLAGCPREQDANAPQASASAAANESAAQAADVSSPARAGQGGPSATPADSQDPPPTTQPELVGPPIRVVTLNILWAQMKTPEQIAAAIAVHKPDVVFLQEAGRDLPARIARALKMNLADTAARSGSAAEERKLRGLETAVIARGRLSDVRVLASDLRAFGVLARTRLADRDLWLISIHQQSSHPGPVVDMIRTTGERRAETDRLLAETARLEGPIVVAGDFNEGADTPSLSRIRQTFDHAWACAGRGSDVTFPGFASGLHIDHVFCTRHLAVTDCFVDKTVVSDHRMVVVTLQFRAKPPTTQSDTP